MLVALGILSLAVVALGLWRRGRGTLLRLAAFAVLLLWLTGPRLVQETRESLRDIGLLVVDRSASMQVGDSDTSGRGRPAVDRGAGVPFARPGTAHDHGSGNRQCRYAIVR